MKAKLLLLSSIILLSACSEEGGNLQEWMNQKKMEAKNKGCFKGSLSEMSLYIAVIEQGGFHLEIRT